jgi:hypothetical protein
MTYALAGTIQASDYNNFTGAAAANVSGQLNTVLSTGKGNAGYGQTAVANVSAAADITATQWTTLVNAINTVRKQQAGAGFTNIGTYTAGATINATADISGNLTNAFTNRLNYQAEGVTTTGATFNSTFTAPNDTNAATFNLSRTATFANGDAARYFFNAGGQLNFVVISNTNTGATGRGADVGNLAVTNFASKRVRAGNAGARTGAGGTLNQDQTGSNVGYYGLTTANTTLTQITSTSTAYTTDIFRFFARTGTANVGGNNDNGTTVVMSAQWSMGAQSPAFNDSINVTVAHRVDVIYPATTFLANTWGTVTIS